MNTERTVRTRQAVVSAAIAAMVVATATIAVMSQRHPAPAAVVAAASKPTPEAGAEGIKVHGHWRFVVSNPDGTVAGEHEFENAVASGGTALLRLLRRADTPGRWSILAGPTGFDRSPCGVGTNATQDCLLLEGPSVPSGSTAITPNLGVVAPETGPLTLDGTLTATAAGLIRLVQTGVFVCGNAVSPGTCYSNQLAAPGGLYFAYPRSVLTWKQLQDPITVAEGQRVRITVKISFS